MKSVLYGLMAVMVVVGLLGYASMGPRRVGAEEGLAAPGKPVPAVVIQPSHVLKLSSKTKVAIMGSGFKPGQEIRLVVTQSDGSMSDIGSQLKPEPVADKYGVWATAWTVGNYSRKEVAKPGVYLLKACDADYEVLATAPFGYYDTKKDYKEWPSWAQAVVKEPKPKKK